MPEATLAAPPAAAPISTPPTPPQSSSPAITVTPAAVDKGPQSPPPPKGSARERMFQDLRKKAGTEETTTTTNKEQDDTTTAEPAVSAEDQKAEQTTTETPPVAGEKKGKVSPWKLVDEHKAARLKAETEVAELRKSIIAPEKIKELETKAEAAARRAQELEQEIQFTNYSKSQEFNEKYQKPYEQAWSKWMGELGELQITDPASGTERALAPQDLLELVNMPLQKAREKAEETFGSFANDVMAARKELRGLFEAQSQALDNARKGGEQRTAQMKEFQQKLNKQIGELWKQYNEAAIADEKVGKFFKPIEGDEEANTRLQKGYEIADRAFSVSPLDTRLTPEQRSEVVRLHAAVRNRAAAFGKLVHMNEKAQATIAELTAELAKYKGAQPGAGEAKREAGEAHSSAKDSVFGALRQLAH